MLFCAWLLLFLELLFGAIFLAAEKTVPPWVVIAAPLLIICAATLIVEYHFRPVFSRLHYKKFKALRTLKKDEIKKIRLNRRKLLIAARSLTMLWAISIPFQSKLMFACGSELWAGLLIIQLFAVFISFLLAWDKTIVNEIVLFPIILLFFITFTAVKLLTALIFLPFQNRAGEKIE